MAWPGPSHNLPTVRYSLASSSQALQAKVLAVCECFKASQASSKLPGFAKMICSFIHFPVNLCLALIGDSDTPCLFSSDVTSLASLQFTAITLNSGPCHHVTDVPLSLLCPTHLGKDVWSLPVPNVQPSVSDCALCVLQAVSHCSVGWGYNLLSAKCNIVILLARPSANWPLVKHPGRTCWTLCWLLSLKSSHLSPLMSQHRASYWKHQWCYITEPHISRMNTPNSDMNQQWSVLNDILHNDTQI